jgi:hypothetical protein
MSARKAGRWFSRKRNEARLAFRLCGARRRRRRAARRARSVRAPRARGAVEVRKASLPGRPRHRATLCAIATADANDRMRPGQGWLRPGMSSRASRRRFFGRAPQQSRMRVAQPSRALVCAFLRSLAIGRYAALPSNRSAISSGKATISSTTAIRIPDPSVGRGRREIAAGRSASESRSRIPFRRQRQRDADGSALLRGAQDSKIGTDQ